MYHEIIITQQELHRAMSFIGVNQGIELAKIPKGSTILKKWVSKETGDYHIAYETPDETPCTISIGIEGFQ